MGPFCWLTRQSMGQPRASLPSVFPAVLTTLFRPMPAYAAVEAAKEALRTGGATKNELPDAVATALGDDAVATYDTVARGDGATGSRAVLTAQVLAATVDRGTPAAAARVQEAVDILVSPHLEADDFGLWADCNLSVQELRAKPIQAALPVAAFLVGLAEATRRARTVVQTPAPVAQPAAQTEAKVPRRRVYVARPDRGAGASRAAVLASAGPRALRHAAAAA
eukprot:TRINITY_DN5390_c0_g1_i1.p2 TRINITY_DN5390_c0_g1~~TRINITY_DN5390_c0_g1_i1.p2  ORF type:complete len:223 (-),score=19.55 TRINITY_DN5390_c0_g1_i1:1204-1872(-)